MAKPKSIAEAARAQEATKALWAKCSTCGHCWPAAYYPIEMAAIARVASKATCPKGCTSPAMLAKQDDGVLLEDSHG